MTEVKDGGAAFPQDSELMEALKPFEAWSAACMKAAPLAPDDMIWAGYEQALIRMGDMRMLYFAIRALAAREGRDG